MDKNAAHLNALAEVRQRYLCSLPDKANRLKQLITHCDTAQPDAVAELNQAIHHLAGSAGMHGLDQISQLARKLDIALENEPDQWHQLQEPLTDLIQMLVTGDEKI